MAEGNFLGTVGLFGDDEAGESMRKDKFREAPEEIGVLADRVVETVGATDQDGDIFIVEEGGLELFGIFV